MDKGKSFSLLVKVTSSFKHCGWVNGLNENQYAALNEAQEYINRVLDFRNRRKDHSSLAKKLRKRGHTIREIASILGYKHPGSVSYLLDKTLKNNK